MGHGPTGADEAYLLVRTSVTRGPTHKGAISITMDDKIHVTITLRLRVHAGRESVCRDWFRELHRSYRWWTVARQNVAVTDAYAPSGGTNTCPWYLLNSFLERRYV